jgi:hypothetical protein
MGRLPLSATMLCLLVGIMMITPAEAALSKTASDLPYDIHLNWQHDTSTTMTIVWETSASTTGSTVKYGPDSTYGFIATGTTDNLGTNGLIHIVEITGLPPATTYHYSCGDDTGGWSSDATFTTAPAGSVDFVFCSMGDSRDNPSEFSKIVGKAAVVNPTFTVFTGDLCGTDSATDYDTWFGNWELLGDHAPIAPALGNHESTAVNYLHRFALPNNERWYSFNYSAMHIIVLSTSLDSYSQGTVQYNWFVSDLTAAANDSAHPWKIVSFHNPPYNVGGHDGDAGVQTYLAPLLSQYKVDLVFNGHNHYYERTYPLKGGGASPTVTDTSLHSYINPTGVIYETTGSCGAPLYDVGTAYYLAVAKKVYNFAKISVFSNNSLHMQAFQDDGTTLIDDFWIVKTTEHHNQPPEAPLIDGPGTGKPGVTYRYNVSTVDSDGDNVSYFIDWGDNTSTGWVGPYASGTGVTVSHSWSKKGAYDIRAKAKDVFGNESTWSTLKVQMPQELAFLQTFFAQLLGRLIGRFPLFGFILGSLLVS